jgi:hypothetical protein
MENEDKNLDLPDDVGVNKAWLKTLVTSEVEKPKTYTEAELKQMVATKPTSRIQELLQEVYFWLVDKLNETTIQGDEVIGPDEDLYDGFWSAMDLDHYNQTYLLSEKLNSILRVLHLKDVTGYGQESQIMEQLSSIAQKVIEEPEYLDRIKEGINSLYPNLIGEFRSVPTSIEVNEKVEQEYREEISKLEAQVESNVDKFQDQLAKIQRAQKTDFEEMAQKLNKIVIFGESLWELTLYALMSPHAPRLIINTMDYRANLHTMFAGDISTAKSKILKLSKRIAPKSLTVDETTKASYEGVSKIGGEIEDGVLDHANGGVIIVEEFTSPFARMPLFRRSMDCEPIVIYKGGHSKPIKVNTTMLTACNPQDDFFRDEINFRKQLAFKEGVLSRFDVLIPLTATSVKNDILLDKLEIMTTQAKLGDKVVDFSEIKETLDTLAQGMSGSITRVTVTPLQAKMMKDAFRGRNDMDQQRRGGVLKNRPLVILRDLETLARLVNIIAAVNFSKRVVNNGIVQASDEDVEKAIQLWENLIQLRIQLYARHDRNLKSVADEIIAYVWRSRNSSSDGTVPIEQVRKYIVDDERLIGRTTFYKEVNTLEEAGRLAIKGKRNKKLSVIVK